ncbi:MAG: N-acetylmuramoyl-L-alanine amidase [Acidobacteria bacterium]|nr:N-acetylmuramoyl-L-alanine amidase [Acidobacteriota bacterium]
METLRPPDQTSARIIEAYCELLESPALRLRFIRKAVARCQDEGVGQGSKWPLFDRFRLRKIVVEELVPLLPAESTVPMPVRLAMTAYRFRVPIYAVSAVASVGLVSVIAYLAVQVVLASYPVPADSIAPPVATAAPAVAGATDLPQYAPEQIWLVEQGDGYEVYSNGARILTEFETDGPPRRYFAFPKGATSPDAAVEHTATPNGIVYHTSQSHIAPFKEEFNDKLQTSARALLEFVSRRRLYNYVIDRFGRVYRVVRDEDAADHAGNSVWADAEFEYLDLSGGTIGICFEAEWRPDTKLAPDEINEAQIYAGRVLTAMLRSKYGISDAMCVTHALVSVSPSSRLIGFHMDWARAFPFAAIGLSDKYAVENPGVALFGFDHDGQFDRAIGEMWPGIPLAERRLAETALATGQKDVELRRDLQLRYRSFKSWLSARDVEAGNGE